MPLRSPLSAMHGYCRLCLPCSVLCLLVQRQRACQGDK
jgi:hypothetical protein